MSVDERSDIVSAQDYYPYGEILRSYTLGSGANNKYLFTEKERDKETNYDYFGARYYDSDLGRWLQIDPLADKYPGWSPYNYTACNPLSYIDPNGMEWYYYQAEGEDEKKWHYHEDTKQRNVWTGDYDKDGNKIMKMQNGIIDLLSFNGKSIILHTANGESYSFPAVSGILDKNGNTQPDMQWQEKGPIPEGWYVAGLGNLQWWGDVSSFNQIISTLSFISEVVIGRKTGEWPGGIYAWGEYRLELSPNKINNRGGFFIHGGGSPGSAGCIDLTKYNNAFFHRYLEYNKTLKLHVGY